MLPRSVAALSQTSALCREAAPGGVHSVGNPCLGFRFQLIDAPFLLVSCRFKDRQMLFTVEVAWPRSFHGPWRLPMAGLNDQSSLLALLLAGPHSV